MSEDKITYFLGGLCIGILVCYAILWLSLNVL